MVAWLVIGLLALLMVGSRARAQPSAGRIDLSGQIELARLIDLCAERLGLQIEYDPAAVKGTVTLRLGETLTNQQLWQLANQLLAARGFTSVQQPGQRLISIVKLAEAPAIARLEHDGEDSPAGFVNVVTSAKHRPVKDLVDAVKLVLSKPSGSVSALGERHLLISDLKPRVDDALRLLELLDSPGPVGDQPTIEKIEAREMAASQLAAMVTAAATARDAISSKPLRGKAISVGEDQGILLVAPASELESWRSLVRQLDQREAVETRSYAPRHFGAAEVAKLIDQLLGRGSSQVAAGERWRVVVDQLTGTLIITATPAEHNQIEQLIQRLDAVPAESRRPVKTYIIRNRRVGDIVEVLTRLVEAGVLESSDAPPDLTGGAGATGNLQQSIREPPVKLDGTVTHTAAAATGVISPQERPVPSPPAARRSSLNGVPPNAVAAAGATTPPLTLTADEGTNTLIAMGESRLLAQLDDLIAQLDVRQTQVMIEVLVLNLSESDTLDLGVELQKLEISGGTFISLSSLFGLGGALRPPPESVGTGGTAFILNPGDFSVLLRALQTLNRGRSTSLPKVLVNNNQQATLDSVLQQPFISTNASDTVATTSFGGTQDAGTTVTIKPQIAEGDHLILEYTVSVSAFVGDAADPRLPPPRQQNNLTSVVTIPDGYTVAVGGLELTSESKATSQVPLLGDIPWLGEAFKSRSNSFNRSRFFVFIRSSILRHGGFEDLKYLSGQDLSAAEVDDPEWPEVQPRIIK